MNSFSRWFLKLDSRLHLISGFGILVGLTLLLEGAVVVSEGQTLPEATLVGALTSVPFILWLVYGGYWVAQSNIPPAQYHRIGVRVLAGVAGFLGINIVLMTAIPPQNVATAVGWIRWAASLGGGAGLLVGFFEARAIHKELEAERARLHREQLRQQRTRIQGFISFVTNDFRDPLAVAQSQLQLAREEARTDHHAEIKDALDRIETRIDEVLTLAREGEQVREPEEVHLSEAAEEAWRIVSTPEASLHIEAETTIHADPDRFHELLKHLFENAIDHGRDDVTVTLGAFDRGIFVEDSGSGIPETRRGEVFVPGYTTDDAGTGLGLAIVRQIAEAHGWSIVITESETGGARFEITEDSSRTVDTSGEEQALRQAL